MLTTFELIVNAFVVIAVLPLAISSLASGSKPPENSSIAKYYQVEPNLMLASNLFLLAVCTIAALKLVGHFGLFDAGTVEAAQNWTMLPFFVLFAAFAFFFVRAFLRVRRAKGA